MSDGKRVLWALECRGRYPGTTWQWVGMCKTREAARDMGRNWDPDFETRVVKYTPEER